MFCFFASQKYQAYLQVRTFAKHSTFQNQKCYYNDFCFSQCFKTTCYETPGPPGQRGPRGLKVYYDQFDKLIKEIQLLQHFCDMDCGGFHRESKEQRGWLDQKEQWEEW